MLRRSTKSRPDAYSYTDHQVNTAGILCSRVRRWRTSSWRIEGAGPVGSGSASYARGGGDGGGIRYGVSHLDLRKIRWAESLTPARPVELSEIVDFLPAGPYGFQ